MHNLYLRPLLATVGAAVGAVVLLFTSLVAAAIPSVAASKWTPWLDRFEAIALTGALLGAGAGLAIAARLQRGDLSEGHLQPRRRGNGRPGRTRVRPPRGGRSI